MAQPSPSRPHFEPDGASLAATAVRDQSPALSSFGALARFEFEAGRGNEGTKILLVEWNEENDAVEIAGNWEVSWEGKSTAVSERDGADGKKHRLYFLLPPGAAVPPIVNIAQEGGKTMQTNPLPAIFPPELGASARTAGKKGVLHTIWGKKRLSVLQKEIEKESKTNPESVGLEMAMQEKQWIEDSFGIGLRLSFQDPGTPRSPTTPGGGRLAEKLKGLRLGTSNSELNTRNPNPQPAEAHPLSPEGNDIAVSSFALFRGGESRSGGTRAVAQRPPSHIVAQQVESQGNNGMSSLDAVAGVGKIQGTGNVDEDDLFAVMVSPRSPEMSKSPFSFSPSETASALRGNAKE